MTNNTPQSAYEKAAKPRKKGKIWGILVLLLATAVLVGGLAILPDRYLKWMDDTYLNNVELSENSGSRYSYRTAINNKVELFEKWLLCSTDVTATTQPYTGSCQAWMDELRVSRLIGNVSGQTKAELVTIVPQNYPTQLELVVYTQGDSTLYFDLESGKALGYYGTMPSWLQMPDIGEVMMALPTLCNAYCNYLHLGSDADQVLSSTFYGENIGKPVTWISQSTDKNVKVTITASNELNYVYVRLGKEEGA